MVGTDREQRVVEILMLLRRIERYIKERRLPPSRFGRDAVGDPCFVFDLRDGREPRQQTVARVDAYFDRMEREQPAARQP